MTHRFRRVLVAATALTSGLASLVLTSPTASAASCYGGYCTNTDPVATGCARDAKTLAADYSYGTTAAVELRYSPTCKTQWARVPRNNWPGGDTLGVVQPSTGWSLGYSGEDGSYVWSRQIYSPVRCSYAWWNDAGWDRAQTACV